MFTDSFLNLAKRVLALGLALLLWSGFARAEVTAITIQSRTPMTGDFGDAGPYELIRGLAEGEIDPQHPNNRIITDIDLVQKNSNGKVGYVATFAIAKPVDMKKASGVLLYEASNRGNGNPMARWPYLRGAVYLDSGWQGDLPASSVNRVTVPIAVNPDGSAITGVALARMADMTAGIKTQTLAVYGRAVPYDATMDQSKARLVKRTSESRWGENGPTFEIPASEWRFANCATVPFPGTPDPRSLCLKDGFDPTYIYEMTYEVKDPFVLGVGLAAWRDVQSFFRYETKDAQGNANPIAKSIKHALAQGTSQAGWALKSFIQLGFNEDERGRQVYDGANTHIAGAVLPMNVRFAVLSGGLSLYEPGSESVQWWHRFPDHFRDRAPAGLLDRCSARKNCPKIMDTFGSTEIYGRLGAFVLTGTSGNDIPLPKNVRLYYFPGTSHGGGRGGFNHAPTNSSSLVLASNPNPESETMAALYTAMVDWVVNDREMPSSKYPLRHRGTLVPNIARTMGFPTIPGVLSPTGKAVGLIDYDFGRLLDYNDLSGVITNQPPKVRQVIPALVPTVDEDGNEIAGVPSLLHMAPLGTYTGWNVTATGFFKDQVPGLSGGYIPFAATRAARLASGDPRLSLEERYGTHRGYMCVIDKAAKEMVAQRYLLEADADSLISQANSTPNLPLTGDAAALKVEMMHCR